MRFSGHRVLITGAGAGIGRLMAERMAGRGAEVIVTARRIDAAREVVKHIVNAGGTAHAYTLDVGKIGSIATLRDKIHEEVGPLTMLINNAGVVFGGEFEKVSLDQHLQTFKVNSEGLMACTHAFLDDLIQAPRGHLVNIASASAFIGLPYGSSYAASKWAVVGFSESLRLELAERGLRNVKVTTVCPSYIATGMFKGVKTPLFSPMLTPDKVVSSILKGIATGEPFVIEPPMARSVELLKGVLPRRLWDQVAKYTGVSTSMYSWKGKRD
ncbi:short-chain dehydrogenase/reductase SDR [Alcanivorax xiamenensis]|uniref:Short-chain dehydrogenase/reductase SDR n=1 Tax=Alcanivorax xiamenensis TaxID=1177156 RepID=A0ABQ6YDQ3_9GAMM|nr:MULTISPECIES: SDR family NAD(P)-dependent oxidoreductase [Alcanivorax]KAF0808459.1 short-chain dehydrogenase/reductase SDR [Alcanivorax xiamenensis]